jgi:hypothetical protein
MLTRFTAQLVAATLAVVALATVVTGPRARRRHRAEPPDV